MVLIGRIVFCACIVACGLPSPTVETTSASVSTFGRYGTFSFENTLGVVGYRESERTGGAQDHMTSLVAKALTDKGYVNVPAGADLIVVLGAGEGETPKTRRITRTAAGEREEFIVIPSGALVIDVFDASTHARVWHGVAMGAVRAEGLDENRLAQAVDKMMVSFPVAHLR